VHTTATAAATYGRRRANVSGWVCALVHCSAPYTAGKRARQPRKMNVCRVITKIAAASASAAWRDNPHAVV